MPFQIHVFGKDEMIARYKRVVSQLPQTVTNSMQTQMTRLADYVRADKLSGQVLQRRTSKLSRSIYGTASASGGQVTGKIGSRGVPYANIWENTGSKAHTIVPVHAKALAFEIGGKLVFAMSVNIPQQAPRPFLKPAMKERQDSIIQALRADVLKVMRGS